MELIILGQAYTVEYQKEKDNPKLEGADGICEPFSKRIILNAIEPDKNTVDKLEDYMAKVFRHEIVHAFFSESGLKDYMHDETLVDWVAVQLPKMVKVMAKAGCL